MSDESPNTAGDNEATVPPSALYQPQIWDQPQPPPEVYQPPQYALPTQTPVLTTAPPFGTGPNADTAAPSRRHARRRRQFYWAAVAVAAAVAVCALVSTVMFYISDSEPGGVVQRYFAALRKGDAATVLGFGQVPAGSRAMLTAPVLKAQNRLGSLSDISVLGVTTTGGSAIVDVQYTLTNSAGHSTITDVIPLVHKGHSWRLKYSAVLVQVAFSGAGNRATVAGVVVPVGPQLMFPGAAPFAFDTPNLQLAPQSSVIRFTDPNGQQAFQVQPSAAGTAAFAASLQTALSACLSGHADNEALCPSPTQTRAVPGTLRGTTALDLTTATGARALTLQVTADVNGMLSGTAQVPVTGTYQQLDFNNMASSANFSGSLTISAHASAITPSVVSWDVS